MGSKTIELITADCPECGEEKLVTVSLSSSCNECGLDALHLKYEISNDKIVEVFSAIFQILDGMELQLLEDRSECLTNDELLQRVNR